MGIFIYKEGVDIYKEGVDNFIIFTWFILYSMSLIKALKQPQFQKVNNHSFQQLKKQCTLYGLTSPPNLNDSNRQQKNIQYLQVNYIKNYLYKVSPQIHSRVPLLKQQENLREYLTQVHNDAQKHEQIRNDLKLNYFFKKNMNKEGKHSSHSTQTKRLSQSQNTKKNHHQSIMELFDPIEYLNEKQSHKKKLLSKNIKKLQGMHNMFAQNIDSVKYISEAPQVKIPEPLPTLASKSLMAFTSNKKEGQLLRTQQEISKSISQIMQKSMQYQQSTSINNKPKRLKHYKSRNDLKKANDKKIMTQRKKIMSMIQQKSSNSPSKPTGLQPTSLDEIPAKQKYNMDFTQYMRTKTKSQLEKYMHQKLIKKPQKDLQKFQQFMLKQVKFQNEQNKHKMERFFIKMRQEFRRVEKYTQRGSKFDWRTQSVKLDDMKKQNQPLGLLSLVKDQLIAANNSKSKEKTRNTNSGVSKKFKSAREKFLKIESKQIKNHSKLRINELSQSVPYRDNQEDQIRQDQQLQL